MASLEHLSGQLDELEQMEMFILTAKDLNISSEKLSEAMLDYVTHQKKTLEHIVNNKLKAMERFNNG